VTIEGMKEKRTMWIKVKRMLAVMRRKRDQ
jgi:hypothetical protein